jgi:hypothetical protein
MNPPLGDRDSMDGAIELPVSLAVEPMALAVARGRGDRGDTGKPG